MSKQSGAGSQMEVATLEVARDCLRKVLKESLSGSVPLPNVKRLFASRFNVKLSPAVFGHKRVSTLLEDPAFQDICSVELQGSGYYVKQKKDHDCALLAGCAKTAPCFSTTSAELPSIAPQDSQEDVCPVMYCVFMMVPTPSHLSGFSHSRTSSVATTACAPSHLPGFSHSRTSSAATTACSSRAESPRRSDILLETEKLRLETSMTDFHDSLENSPRQPLYPQRPMPLDEVATEEALAEAVADDFCLARRPILPVQALRDHGLSVKGTFLHIAPALPTPRKRASSVPRSMGSQSLLEDSPICVPRTPSCCFLPTPRDD